MKLGNDFVVQPMGEKNYLISVGKGTEKFNGFVELNSTAVFVVEMLKSETELADIVSGVCEAYDASEARVTEDVNELLDILRGINAIEE